MPDHAHTNRLIHETSPYLLQHAHNPVEWYPWGEDALGAARAEDKPILLSIGYSACHWCHVMERESFENPGIATLMNDLFVNIKVDREERPDLDHIYMTAVQLLTGRGGWPMTVFLRPDGKPFHGGTYFPPVERHGMPAFPRLLELVARKYRESPEEIDQAVSEIAKHLQPQKFRAGGTTTASQLLPAAAEALSATYDQVHGGLGEAPKFPNTAPLDLWLRASHAGGDTRYADMALHTLRQMARGGMYDQLGGGFHRYSVDREWLVPHFEKMLYDNAQLVPLYLSAYQNTRDVFFANIARDTLDYVAREMRDPRGGFYSSQDADSEGVEGKYFVWDRHEVVAILGAETADVVCPYWDITEPGNFEGRNILRIILETGQLARMFGGGDGFDESHILSEARDKLLATRRRRIAPARDDKMLTSWNALMISAFARAAEVFGDAGYAEVARGAVAFVDANLRREARLLATCTGAGAKLNGYLDDYAFYAAALLDVFEAVQDQSYLDSARTLCDAMLAHFWDNDAGGLFFTSDDHEDLIVRSKPTFDGSIPSGNSVATMVLLRLYHHTADARYLERAEAVLSLLGPVAADQPFGLANLIAAADFHHSGPREIAVVVDRATGATDPIVRRLRATYLPNRTLTFVDPDPAVPRPAVPGTPLATLLAGKGQVDGKTTVYVCHRRTCSPPATEWEDIAQLLS